MQHRPFSFLTESILLFVGLLPLLSGCIPSYNHKCGDVDTLEEVRSFFVFDVGTQWVYENQLSLERDTFIVVESMYLEEESFETLISRSLDSSMVSFSHKYYETFMDDYDCVQRIVDIRTSTSFNNMSGISSITFPLKQNEPFRAHPYRFYTSVQGLVKSIDYDCVPGVACSKIITLESDLFAFNGSNRDQYRYQIGENVGLISYENLDSLTGKWQLVSFQSY